MPTTIHRTLPNGLTIIAREDHSAPVASVQAWCRVGSIDENEWLGAGLSHFLEHMLFKGTATRSASEIAGGIQDLGGTINAYTSFDRTVYWADTPAEGVSQALDILCDVISEASLPVEEFEKEKEVIRREFAMGFDDPARMSIQELFATAFPHHPYRHPIIGHLDLFNQITRDDLHAFYRRHYIPQNLLLSVVGAIDAPAILAHVEKLLGAIPRGRHTPLAQATEKPPIIPRESHREFPTELSRLHFGWIIPEITHPDIPALDVLSIVLGQGRSARLVQEIRESAQLAHHLSCSAYTLAQGGLFIASAQCEPAQREATQEAILAQIDRLHRAPITADELSKARKICANDFLHELSTARGQATALASSWFQTRTLHFSEHYLQAIEAVTVEDTQRVARHYLGRSQSTLISLNPPQEKTTARRAGNGTRRRVEKHTLPHGLTLLIGEDHRLPLVHLHGTFAGGLLVENAATSGLTRLFAHVWPKGTTHAGQTLSAAQIAERIENVGGSIHCGSGQNSLTATVELMREDFALGISTLGELILHPQLAPREIEREKSAQIAKIHSENDHPLRVATRALRQQLFPPAHPYCRHPLGTVETVTALEEKDLRTFHRRIVSGRNGILTVMGDVDPSAVVDSVSRALDALPPGEPIITGAQAPTPPLPASQRHTIALDKEQVVFAIGYRTPPIYSPDRPGLLLLHEACNDLSSRLFVRIREELGLAYYVGASMFVGPGNGGIYFYAGTSPQAADEVEKVLQDEIDHLGRGGLSAAELERAQKTYVGKEQISEQELGSWATTCALDELYGFGFDHAAKFRQHIATLTPEEVADIARRTLSGQPHITVRVGPALN